MSISLEHLSGTGMEWRAGDEVHLTTSPGAGVVSGLDVWGTVVGVADGKIRSAWFPFPRNPQQHLRLICRPDGFDLDIRPGPQPECLTPSIKVEVIYGGTVYAVQKHLPHLWHQELLTHSLGEQALEEVVAFMRQEGAFK